MSHTVYRDEHPANSPFPDAIQASLGQRIFALAETCSHLGGPLAEGKLSDNSVQCPWHGSRFCMRDGRVLTGPATVNAPRYDVRVRQGQVEVKRIGEH